MRAALTRWSRPTPTRRMRPARLWMRWRRAGALSRAPELGPGHLRDLGAESNEKALHLAENGRGKHCLGDEGSFHGRTLPLHGTWNPVKRGPFEFAGFEAEWADFPRHLVPKVEPDLPAGWVAARREGRS